MTERSFKEKNEPVAIIGIGCRYPGSANTPGAFWENLKKGVDCITEVPASRWDWLNFYSANKDKAGKLHTKWGGYIDDIDKFDPLFFGITPREADYMDPQQRKLLEVTWEALEDGGQKPTELAGKPVGVFIGAFTLDYKILQFSGTTHHNLAAHSSTGIMMTMVSNRISYVFDFRGPSISVDTACSSSLVAVHLACESLRSGESCLAIAGGVLLQLAPQYTIAESKGGFLSPTGWSHAFDASANGYVRAEGVGVVVLKRLSEALRDGDPIYAVIIGNAVNQDGHTNGITVPNGESQKELIKTACAKAGITPGSIQYIEAHGTGTPVGDPIEANSLGEVLSIDRNPKEKCYIGSVKTNIGHTEAAAGVAGLIKAALCLKHKQIPPHLHLKEINPKIAIDQWPYEIPQKLMPWPKHAGPARAGVNSFGYGGTNAFVILQEAPSLKTAAPKGSPEVERPKILPLTSRDPEVFKDMAGNYKTLLTKGDQDQVSLKDLGYTAGVKREHLDNRLALVYSSKEDLLRKFDLCIAGEEDPLIVKGKKRPAEKRKLVWVFTGMGPQWWGMGRELFEKEPVYRSIIERCDREMSKWVDWSLIKELNAAEADSRMEETWLSQPANFALQIALAGLWRSFGIEPDAIIGHSTGEAAAFYEAGVYSFEDAVKVIINRSRLQQRLSGTGKMVAVGLSAAEIQPLLAAYGDQISIAAVNSPSSVTLSGDESALLEFTQLLQAKNIFNKFLHVKIPFHSGKMEPIRDELLEALKDIKPRQAKTPLYSTVTGGRVDGTELDAAYWWRNVRRSVLFAQAIEGIINDNYSIFLEIGPHPVLANSITECLAAQEKEGRIMASIRRKEPEQERFMTSLAELYCLGFDINWKELYPNGKFVTLPAYPWRKDRYWVEPLEVEKRRLGFMDHPLLGRRMFTPAPSWETNVDPEKVPYLRDHRIQGNVVFPAAGYIEMAFGALKALFGDGNFSLEELDFRKALFLEEVQIPRVQFLLDEEKSMFKIVTYEDEKNNASSHACGRARLIQKTKIGPEIDLETVKDGFDKHLSGQDCYRKLDGMGYNYGHCFQGIKEVWLNDGEALAKIEVAEELLPQIPEYYFHPAIMDACFQTLIAAQFSKADSKDDSAIRLPVSIKRIRVVPGHTGPLYALARINAEDQESLSGDVYLYSENGEAIGEINGFVARGVDQATGNVGLNTIDSWLYQVDWQEQETLPGEGEIEKNISNGPSAWLIFADNRGVGLELARLLEERGENYCLVKSGPGFELTGAQTATIAPDSKEDLVRLMEKVFKEKNCECKGIIHLWNLDVPGINSVNLGGIQQAKELGPYSILNIAKTIEELNSAAKLWIITRGAQVMGEGGDNVSVMAAPVWGIGRVLGQQEMTENWGGLIDLDPALSRTTLKEDALQIMAELFQGDGETEVAFRDGKRYVPRLNPAAGLTKPLSVQFRSDGCYIITGAFGALGQLVARMMCKHGAGHLILMSRAKFPARNEWGKVDPGSDTGKKIAFIKELEALGANIHLASVDITDEEQLSRYLKEFKEMDYPPIRGVIYSAGIVNDALVTRMDRKAFDAVYDTKVYGSFLLHKYLQDEPLDYFILFSSVATLVTTSGQTNYAAGNAFLDALAQYRRMQGLPALSINWGPWAIGMIKDLNLIEHYRNSRGMNCILPEVGMTVLERVIGQDLSEIVICEADWSRVLAWYLKHPALFAHLAKAENAETAVEDTGLGNLAEADPETRKSLIEEHLADLIANVLRCKRSQVELNQSLNALGIDSIMATELRNKIANHFGQNIPIVRLLSGSSIAKLAEELLENINESLAVKQNEAAAAIDNLARVLESDQQEEQNGEELTVVDEYPLSYGQKAIWFINQLLPDSAAYNIGGAMYIPSQLNIDALDQAVKDIISRHPALRTNFFIREGEPYQRVYAARQEGLTVIDVQGKSWDEIRRMIIADNQKPFDLAEDPLYRIRLYKQSEKDYYFAVTIYHIISDAWSNYMFIDEMQALYNKYANGKTADLPKPTASYKEFVEWENRMVNSLKGSRMFQYWKNHLPEEIPILNLPTDKPRPKVQTSNGASYNFIIDEQLTKGLKELSKTGEATAFMVLLSVFYILLNKYSAQEDIIVGSPVAGRTQPQFSKVYGYFVNPLPLRASFKGDPSFNDFLQQVKQTVLKGLENQEYPFALLVERLGLERDPSRSAVFQVLFVLLNHRVEQTGMDQNNVASYAGFPMKLLEIPEEEGQFDLTLTMYEENGVYHATYKYNSDLFLESTVAKMAGHYNALLAEIIANPAKPVSQYSLLTPAERKLIVEEWSGVKNIRSAGGFLIHQLIEAVAEQKKDAIAVAVPYEDGNTDYLTYGQLNRKANQFAHYLRDMGVGPNTLVGVCLDKSPEMIVTLLAVMKAGGAYIPLDPNYPKDRIARVMDQSGAEILITRSSLNLELDDVAQRLVRVDTDREEIERMIDTNPDHLNSPSDLVYVVYTSGSTGLPKGVMVTHENLASIYKAWESEYRLLTETSSHLQMANFSFDVFSGDLVRGLCSGSKLVLCRKEILLNIPLLYEIMLREQVDAGEFVPSVIRNMLQFLMASGKKLDFMKLLIVGSDSWTVDEYELLKSYSGPATRVINSYGLSEATIDSTYFEGDISMYESGTTTPIGRPFSNTSVYILDQFMKPVPVGVPGELYIGGHGVAAGYVNATAEMAERFIGYSLDGGPEIRLYKTGDMAKWDEKGNIHILQRLDNQVKIRGYRIELGEIEKHLLNCAGIKQALVTVKQDRKGEKAICAYYITDENSPVDPRELHGELSEKLPNYMVPAFFIPVSDFPVTPNGKIDVKGLPLPDFAMENTTVDEPQNMYEKKVAEIWAQLLGGSNIGRQQDFFMMGGNSLHLIELMIRLQDEFKISLTVNQLFKNTTVEGMARTIEDIVTGKEKGAEPYIVYNQGRDQVIYCFPPAGGYSLVYQSLAKARPDLTLVSFNYLSGEDKIKRYADMIQSYGQGPYVLFGYSMGGNLSFEVGKELEKRGQEVSHVIIMDSYRITDSFKPAEEDLKKFEKELAEHFKKHTGSAVVQKHTLDQAKDYINFCYQVKNTGRVKAEVVLITENNPADPNRKVRESSWDGSSLTATRVYRGAGFHADMLDEENIHENAKIIADILKSKKQVAGSHK